MCIPSEDMHSRWVTSPFLVPSEAHPHSRWVTSPFLVPSEAHPHSWWGCAFLVSHIPIPGEDVYSQWGTSPFPVRMCIPGKSHPHSWWGCAFPVSHIPTPSSQWGTSPFPVRMCIPGESHPHSRWVTSPFPIRIFIPNEAHPHSRWGCAFPVSHIPIPGGDVYSQWGTSHSQFPVRHIPIPGVDDSLGMHILIKNGDVLQREWGCDSSGMYIFAGNSHSYIVYTGWAANEMKRQSSIKLLSILLLWWPQTGAI